MDAPAAGALRSSGPCDLKMQEASDFGYVPDLIIDYEINEGTAMGNLNDYQAILSTIPPEAYLDPDRACARQQT